MVDTENENSEVKVEVSKESSKDVDASQSTTCDTTILDSKQASDSEKSKQPKEENASPQDKETSNNNKDESETVETNEEKTSNEKESKEQLPKEKPKEDTDPQDTSLQENSSFFHPISGVEAQQGRRQAMEDTHKVIDDVKKEFPELSLKQERCSYYGVYDGHGGTEAAILCEKILHDKIIRDPAFIENNIEEAIKNGFRNADQEIIEQAKKGNWMSGTTVVISIIADNELYIANAGDSEAVLARRGNDSYIPHTLSHKHKPGEALEKERIKKAGGHVVFNRVMGSLAVARALGDKDFKYPFNKGEGDFVSGEPYITKYELQPEDDFLIISCDGLWDRLSYQQAVDVVAHCRNVGKTPKEAARLLVRNSIEKGTLDNVTAIIVYLTPPPKRKDPSEEENQEEEKMDVWEFLKLMQEEKNKAKEASKLDFNKFFGLPENEKILEEHYCGIGKQVLTHGILIITDNFVCFHSSNMLSKNKTIKISIKDVQEIQKQKTLLIAHAIKISTYNGKKYIFNWKQNATGRDSAFSRLMELVKDAPIEEKEVSSDSSSELIFEEEEEHAPNINIGSWSRFDD